MPYAPLRISLGHSYVPSRPKYRPVFLKRISISFFYFYPRVRRRMKSAIGSAALRLQRCPRVRAPPPVAGRREGRRSGRRQRPRRGCGLRRIPRPIRSSDVFSRSLLIGFQFCLGYLLGGDSRLVEKFRFLCKATTAFTLFTKTCRC